MKLKNKLLCVAIATSGSALLNPSYAALNANAPLIFADGVTSCLSGGVYPNCLHGLTKVATGSYFTMDMNGDGNFFQPERVAINNAADGLILGTPQPLISPTDPVVGSIDFNWDFANNNGRHHTTQGLVLSSIPTANTAEIDMTGWTVNWGAPGAEVDIDMGTGTPGNASTGGPALITCDTSCAPGENFTLQYSTVVPVDQPFENVNYELYMEGIIGNISPTAAADIININEGDGAIIINPFADNGNGLDTDGGDGPASLTVTALGGEETLGSASITGAGTTITYTPASLTTKGIDTFTYTLSDDGGTTTASASITVNINPVPSGGNDVDTVTTLNGSVIIDVAANDQDQLASDVGTSNFNGTLDLTSIIPTNGTTGTVTDNNDGTVTYTDTSGVNTTADSFTYTIADTQGARSSDITVSTTVNTGNIAGPANDFSRSTDKGVAVTLDIPALNTDSDGIDTTSVVTIPASGGTTASGSTVTVNGAGVITYTPAAGYANSNVSPAVAADTFTYTFDDLNASPATSNSATVTITVTNASPVSSTGSANMTLSDTSVDIDVAALSSDSDGTIDNTSVVTLPASGGNTANGSITVSGTGVVTYTPDAGFTGSDSFSYNVADNNGARSTTQLITVNRAISGTEIATLPADAIVVAGTGQSSASGLSTSDVGIDGRAEQQCIGGCLSYALSNIGANTTATIVVQLSQPIPAGAVYRILDPDGIWVNFVNDTNNEIQSAPLVSGSCPGVSDTVNYTTGPAENNQCIRLKIEDGGIYDADPATTGQIETRPNGVVVKSEITGLTDGCSMTGTHVSSSDRADWWLVSGFLILLGMLRLKRNKA